MSRFILRRVLLGILVLFLVSVVVFAATQALPGDPALAILGRSATPQSLAALRRQLHLDQPVLSQYWTWIVGVLHGNLGQSLAAQEPVTTLLGPKLVNSGVLVADLGRGVDSAVDRDRLVGGAQAREALRPASSNLLLRAGGAAGIRRRRRARDPVRHDGVPCLSRRQHGSARDRGRGTTRVALVLPDLTLVIAVAPYVARIMRASMIEVLESDYVEMARLKGLPERTVLIRHALPNALGPVFQVIALNLAYLAGGIIVIEYVFNYSGIGSAMQEAVLNHDLPVVQALAMLIAAVYVVLNLMADVATILVTPRLRTRL